MRRTATFALAVSLGLSGLTGLAGASAAAGPVGKVPTARGTAAPAGDPASDRALGRLRADADGALRVHRGRDGDVDFVGTAADDTIDNPVRTPRVGPVGAAREDLARYGAALGVDRPDRELVLDGRAASASGGAVVRFDQTVSGLPVVGGQVVVTLDHAGGLTSIQATTSAAGSADAARVGRPAAAATARRVTARKHRLAPGALSVTGGGLSVFDPAVLGAEGAFPPGAARTVRGFTVAHGVDVRETVLVDAVSGRVLLHFNDVQHALDREVCDRGNHGGDESPCVKGVRSEGDPATSVADVNSAYDLTGEVSRMYADIGHLDLTELIGRGAAGSRTLASTVRFCDVPDPNRTCTYDNAFWNGEQMFYGAGYAGADDVVGHEITHGVISHYANLFYFFQSGAINESLADVMGEILDHRRARPGEQASVWRIGEDLPGGAMRNLARPTEFGQPDKMTSSLYDADPTLEDSGGVHTNSGVGNKTAYLVSQGGTFNGVTVQGIDAGDPDLTKTATLYLQVIQSLTSGGDYADLGRVLAQSCADLAGAGTAGFTTGDCTEVAAAVRATELAKQPPAAATPADASRRCPAGTTRTVLFDDEHAPAADEMTPQTLWTRAPRASFRGAVVEENATSGAGSWFALDPAPELGDPTRSSLTLTDALRVRKGVKTYLRFQHWYAFDYDPSVQPADYYDGGVVLVDDVSDTAGAQQTAGLPWVNGPTRSVLGTGPATKGFGGLSNGWSASRVDLSSYAGRTVRPQFQVRGDREFGVLGWYLDDVEVYSCDPVLPSAARSVAVAGGIQSAKLTWSAPSYVAQGISGYRVARRGSAAIVLGTTSRTAAFETLAPGVAHTFTVTPLNPAGAAGPTTSVTAQGSRFSYSVAPTGTSSTRLSGRLLSSSSKGLAGRSVVVQRQAADGVFHSLRTVTTSSTGTFGVTVTGRSKAGYRLVFRGADRLIGSRSGVRHL